MTQSFGTVTVVGVGLLGGSLGLALKERGLARTVRGVGRRQESLDTALSLGAIDEPFLNARDAVRGADLIVLCTPASLILSELDSIRPLISMSAVVTDVASTKAEICAHARKTWSEPYRFVGSHPMAGSEKYGPEHATPHLYDGCAAIVEPRVDHAEDAHETVCSLWRAVGARVVEVDPSLHDGLVARTSHIPHILAAIIAELAAGAGDVHALVGRGFRDVTRIAAGRPEIWRDICLTNRKAIVEGLDETAGQITAVRQLIEEGSADELEAFFRSAQAARSKALGE